MSWFYERFTKKSEKNGEIVCRRILGRWNVVVDGYSQSGDYSFAMHKKAIKKFPKNTVVKKALILGLGGGSIVELLHRKFKDVEVSVIEWDPVMIEISKQINMYKPEYEPRFLLGDASIILPTLHEQFDFIYVDLFRGPDLAPATLTSKFSYLLKAVSHYQTLLLINALSSQELLSIIGQTFSPVSQWRFHCNLLGLFLADK